MPRSRSVFSFRNSQGKLSVPNPLTPGKYAVYFTFSSTRKTWLNSALSLVKRTFYQTVNVRKISRSWLVFPLRKRQGQLGIHHHLTEGKYAVHVTLSSTWKTGLNSSFSLVNRKFYQTVNVVKISPSWILFRLRGNTRKTRGKTQHSPALTPGKHAIHFTFSSPWQTLFKSAFWTSFYHRYQQRVNSPLTAVFYLGPNISRQEFPQLYFDYLISKNFAKKPVSENITTEIDFSVISVQQILNTIRLIWGLS